MNARSDRQIDVSGVTAPRRWRVVGGIAGLVLVVLAVGVALSRAPLTDALTALASPDEAALRHLCTLVTTTIAGTALSAEVLLRLTRRFGAVGRGEMLALVAASTLLNYLPMRPGLLGRLAWHRVVNGIPTAAVARTVVEALLITGSLVALLTVGLLLAHALALPWAVAALLPLVAALLCAGHRSTRAYAAPAALRHVEILLWTVRVHAGFALVGVNLDAFAALGLTAAAVGASMIPLVGNGLGVREWTVGTLSPVLAGVDLAVGISADLISRTVEIAVVVPIGLVAVAWLAHRRRRSGLTASAQSPGHGP